MADWLSFWNKDTRAQNKLKLKGKVVGSIYIPYGEGLVAKGDTVYCVGIEDGELLLITRVKVAKVLSHPQPKWIRITAAPSSVVADYKRTVPKPVIKLLRYRRKNGEERSFEFNGVKVKPSPFQGYASIRELSKGMVDLDALL